MKNHHTLIAAFGSLVLAQACLVQAHDHYAAGFTDTNSNGVANAGEPLALIGPFTETVLVNNVQTTRALQFVGPTGGPFRFVHTDDGTERVFHLLPRPFGQRPVQRCGGYYMLDERPRTLAPFDAFSFIALSDGQFDVPHPSHARTGSWIWLEIVSVSGPAGGRFGFWDENSSAISDTPTISFLANQPTGAYRLVISEGLDESSEDPAGHIHGRSWTADKPGYYVVGFRLVDRSTTGPGGGPWHTPSPVYLFRFRAGPSFQPLVQPKANGSVVLTWSSRMGYWAADASQTGIVFTVERSSSLAPGAWQTLGTVAGTTADTATFTDSTPPAGRALYRVKYSWSTP